MKKILFPLIALLFVFAYAAAYADDSMNVPGESGGKTITNDDLSGYGTNRDNATVNPSPAIPNAEGSGAGGRSDDSGTWRDDTYKDRQPVDKGSGNTDTGREVRGLDGY